MRNLEYFKVSEMKLQEKIIINGGSALTRKIMWVFGWLAGNAYKTSQAGARIGRPL